MAYDLLVLRLLGMFICGGFSTFFIYKVYRKKKREIEDVIPSLDEDKRVETMVVLGGCHKWVIWIFLPLVIWFLISIIGKIE